MWKKCSVLNKLYLFVHTLPDFKITWGKIGIILFIIIVVVIIVIIRQK